MFASVINWTIDPPLSEVADRDRLMRDLVERTIGTARQQGVVDIVMIEAEPDLIMGVSLYESLDEAFAVGSAELVEISRIYADRLHLVSRVVGRAYDAPSMNLVDRTDSQRWRDDAHAMYASIDTWRLDSSLRVPDALGTYLREAMAGYLPLLRPFGLVDLLIVRLADDVILAVHLHSEHIGGNSAYKAAIDETKMILGDKVQFIKGHAGRAFDTPQLLGHR